MVCAKIEKILKNISFEKYKHSEKYKTTRTLAVSMSKQRKDEISSTVVVVVVAGRRGFGTLALVRGHRGQIKTKVGRRATQSGGKTGGRGTQRE